MGTRRIPGLGPPGQGLGEAGPEPPPDCPPSAFSRGGSQFPDEHCPGEDRLHPLRLPDGPVSLEGL